MIAEDRASHHLNSDWEAFPKKSSKDRSMENCFEIFAVQLAGEMESEDFVFFIEEGSKVPNVGINTVYKKVADKVRPVDLGVSDGSKPGGDDDWFTASQKAKPNKPSPKFSDLLLGRFSTLEPGHRLTKERAGELIIGNDLTTKERELLLQALTNHEEALAFDWTHLGTIRPEVAPAQEIRTIEHSAWQETAFPIPKVLIRKVIEMLKDRLRKGVLE